MKDKFWQFGVIFYIIAICFSWTTSFSFLNTTIVREIVWILMISSIGLFSYSLSTGRKMTFSIKETIKAEMEIKIWALVLVYITLFNLAIYLNLYEENIGHALLYDEGDYCRIVKNEQSTIIPREKYRQLIKYENLVLVSILLVMFSISHLQLNKRKPEVLARSANQIV